jgi:hypothetical protein
MQSGTMAGVEATTPHRARTVKPARGRNTPLWVLELLEGLVLPPIA